MLGETTVAQTDKKGTILLLCSDGVLLAVLRETLEEQGYVVLPVSNIGAAIDQLGRSSPDLLIVRPRIDSISGHDAALYLRSRRHGLRILMVTGFLDDDRIRYREEHRGVEVFPKPFTATEFLEKVRQVLAQPPAERAVH